MLPFCHWHPAEGALGDARGAAGRAQHVAAVEPGVNLERHADFACSRLIHLLLQSADEFNQHCSGDIHAIFRGNLREHN
jgi:hypothetical protein